MRRCMCCLHVFLNTSQKSAATMIRNQRRLLSSTVIRRFHQPVVNGRRPPEICCYSVRANPIRFVRPSISNSCCNNNSRLLTFPYSRNFSSVVQESANTEQSSTTKQTVAEQIDPLKRDLPTSSWVQVNYIPLTSNLEDILNSVAKTMNEEYSTKGIIDLDGLWNPQEDEAPPMLKDLDTSRWVEAAYIVLSPYGRPTGWRLRLPNRSVAHSFIESTKEKPFRCVWKDTEVVPWKGRDQDLLSQLAAQVSDAALRVENCSEDMTPGQCRFLFRRYDLAWEGPTVIQLGGERVANRLVPNTFVVRFADPSWARAALRELQSVDFRGNLLMLAQYPKQLI